MSRNERVGLLDDYDDSDEENDFFLKGPPPASDKIKRVQDQVNDVTQVMKENISKVLERGENVSQLQENSEQLSMSSRGFVEGSRRMRRRLWWQNMKMKLFIVAIIALIIIVIIIIVATKKN